MPLEISRKRYGALYGPTVGDKVRLADTDLIIEIEKDLLKYGDEIVFGGGKSARDGCGQASGVLRKDSLDLVITNAIVMDPILGIIKADIGVKDGLIAGVGNAGNPNIMDDIDMVISSNTEVIAGEHVICTPGTIDTHVHFVSPQQAIEAICNGTTTMIGGGTGPAEGTKATTCTPGSWNIHRMIEAVEELPLNFGFLAKGNDSQEPALMEQIQAGALGLKLHEDWGSTPATIDSALKVADKTDTQVAIHTDTLNECGYVDDTIEAIAGRTIHTYHTEGAGGGHAPDIMKIAGEKNILPSSTNPTRPFTVNTISEHLDMMMVCHHLNPSVPEDGHWLRPRTLGTDTGYDSGDFLLELEGKDIEPHVPIRKGRIVSETDQAEARRRARHRMRSKRHAISQRVRKRVEQVIGWTKTNGGLARTRFIGRKRIEMDAYFTAAAHNLLRMTRLAET